MAVDVPDMVAKVMESHEDIDTVQDAISLRALMGKCYALLRMRALMGKCYALLRMKPLSIACSEGFVVISCGKVDYDKSG
jgi:hypothetical protein